MIGLNNYADVIDATFSGTVTSGDYNTGGLVGKEKGSNSYTRVSAEGAVDTGGEYKVGGLIGIVDSEGSGSTINDSYATGDVEGDQDVGGLIGKNDGADVTNSYATGNVTSGDYYTGGLVGYEIGSNIYTGVYAEGNVDTNGEYQVGGLIGIVDSEASGSTIDDSYATGDVEGGQDVGGLVGLNKEAVVTKSYSVGKVTGTDKNFGGLVGLDEGGSYSNSFWDNQTSEQASSAGGTAKTTGDMKDVATFTDSDTDGLDDPWDFVGNPNDDEGEENIWNIGGSINDGYPYLEQLADADPASVSGDVFEGDGVTRVSDGTVEIYFYQQNGSNDADETADLDDGSYSFDGLVADDYHLVVTGATDHQDDERNISLNAGESATEDFTLTEITVVDSISVDTQPDTLDYDSGDALHLSGLVINETRSDGTTDTTSFGDPGWSNYTAVPANDTELVDSDDRSTITITHSDSGETADTSTLSVATVVESISVETQPALTYDSGESLNLSGMEVTETYTDGSTSTVTYGDNSWDSNYSADPSDETTLEDSDNRSTVTVTHTDSGETADTGSLTVNAVVDSISVKNQPNLTYDSGESLNLTGMEVIETYTDGSTAIATFTDGTHSDYSADPSDGTMLEEGDDGSIVTVTHTDSGETAGTDTLTVNTDGDGSDGANSIAIQTEPDGTQTAGETLTSPPKVSVTDEHGNAVEGVDVTVTENSDYSFDSGTTTQTTGSDGVATFDDLVIETAGTSYELNFSISSGDHNVTAGDTASSQTFEVESAAADSVVIQTQPDVTQTANETLTGLPAVNVTDEHRNAVEGANVTVALKPVGDPQDFGYNSTLTVLTNESGIATFDNLVVNTTTGDYRLEFNVNPSVTSEIFSMEAAADTTPPEITNFIVNNTEGQTVEVSFDSDKELSKINSNGTDDADGTNLVMSNFTQSGNLTNGFTYTATLSENEDGTFGATLGTAEDANDNDGASDESDSVMIDTSNDGDGSSGGSGGDGSSGGGNGNSINETDTGDNQSQSVTRQPSTDGSIGFAVSDSDGAGNILLSLTDEADDATEEPTGRNVDHDSLSVQPTETGTREFNISVRQWDASTETNESTNDRFFEETGSSAIGYVEVTHSNSDDDIEGVTFQFRVQSAYLDEHDIESEDLALYRDETGRWNELDATEVETTDTHHVFEAESPGLSLFAVGAPDSTEPTSGPDAVVTVSPSVVTVGEEVTLDGSDSTNEDGEITAYNWSVNGETLTGEVVTVTADEPGEYTVELTVTNDAGETDTTVTDLTVTAGEETSDNGLPTTTDDETPVGFAIYAIIVLLVVVVAVIAWGVRRRRSEDDDPTW